MDIRKNIAKLTLLTTSLIISHSAFAANCTNDPDEPLDGLNLILTSDGLTSEGHMLVGGAITLSAEASWQSTTMYSNALSVELWLDGSKRYSGTANPNTGYIGISSPFTGLSRGTHSASAESPQATNCSSSGGFVVQSKPTASANGNYSAQVDENIVSSTVAVTLSGTHSVDSDYSINKSSPDVSWKVNGVTYNNSNPTINLSAGTYSATYKVDDGIFTDSDTATITILDPLKVGVLSAETVCHGAVGKVVLGWSSSSAASYYELEYRHDDGPWTSYGTVSTNDDLIESVSGSNNFDSYKVRACNSVKCGAYKAKRYYTPECSGGGVPN